MRRDVAESFVQMLASVSPAVRRAALAKAARYQRQIDAGNAVRVLRAAADLNQGELATLLNVKQPAVAKMERQNDMKLSTLAAIAAALGGTVSLRVKLPHRAKPIDIPFAGAGEAGAADATVR